jgi:hypothetical protein
MMINQKITGVLIFVLLVQNGIANAQIDTLRVFSYSVLYIGDTPPCQGPHSVYEGYLETILSYANPDIAGLVKRESEDMYGSAPVGFADSLLVNSFNAAYPGRYAYCPYTNTAEADNITTLYYNQQKLGFAGMLCSYSNITDFDTYKLFYKSANLASTHDTIFLYVTLNHDNSGSSSSNAATRGEQIAGEMAQIETYFTSLPNMINMGDFNTQNSSEACYQTLVTPANLNYRYYDPPFYPDATFTYPAGWDADPAAYASYLTVSTRETSSDPNSCSGNSGGGKLWFDHIFLSANIINQADHVSYIPHSFQVIGNDGNRVGNPENSSPANTSAPAAVINDIFQMSEHYPITLSLLVDTSAAASVTAILPQQEKVTVVNPVDGQLVMYFTKGLAGKTINITCIDELGRLQMKTSIASAGETAQIPCTLSPGFYFLRFTTPMAIGGEVISQVAIQKR